MPVEFLEHQPVEFIPHADPNLPTGEGIIPGVGVEGDTGARQGPELIPPRPPPRDIATLPPVRFGQQRSMVGQALAGTANLAMDVTSAFAQNPEYLMMSTRLGKAAMTIPALVQMGKLLPAEGANALLAAKQGDIQGTIQHGGAALLAALGIRQTLAPKATAALAEMQGPPVLGRMLETARGAPAPIAERPPLDLLPPEEAAGQASAMTRAATAAYEPPRQPRPKPEVPATPPEPYETVLQAIRNAKADTTSKVQALFPAAQLSRQQAADLRRQAFGQEKPVPPAAEPIMDKLTEAIDKGDFNAVRKEAQKLAVFDEVPESVFKEAEKPKTKYAEVNPASMSLRDYEQLVSGEKVVAAASKTDKGNILTAAAHPLIEPPRGETIIDEGFVTNKGRYIDRSEAAMLTGGDYWRSVVEGAESGSTEGVMAIPEEPRPVEARQYWEFKGGKLPIEPPKAEAPPKPPEEPPAAPPAEPVPKPPPKPPAEPLSMNFAQFLHTPREGALAEAIAQVSNRDAMTPRELFDTLVERGAIQYPKATTADILGKQLPPKLETPPVTEVGIFPVGTKVQYDVMGTTDSGTVTGIRGNVMSVKLDSGGTYEVPAGSFNVREAPKETPPAPAPAEAPPVATKPSIERIVTTQAEIEAFQEQGKLRDEKIKKLKAVIKTSAKGLSGVAENTPRAEQFREDIAAAKSDIARLEKEKEEAVPPRLGTPEELKAIVENIVKNKTPRAAKDIKSELVSQLEKALKEAPEERGPYAKTITIDIPGDGVYTLVNTKKALETALARAKKISTSSNESPRYITRGTSKADREWIKQQLAAQKIGPGPGAQTAGEPPIIGMGGATPQEFMPGQGRPTSTNNAVVDQERAERGLPPMSPVLRKDWGKAADEAIAKMDADPQLQDKIIAGLLENPRPLKDWENYAVLQRRMDLRNELEKALRSGAQAYEDAQKAEMAGDLAQAESRRADIELAKQQANIWEAKLQEWERAVGRGGAGTELGRGLAARKMMMNEDFSLASMVMQRRAAKGFEPLTDKEMADTVQNQKDIENTQRKLDEKQTASDQKKAEQAVDETIRDITRTKPKPGQEQPTLDKLKDKLTDKLESDGPDGVGNLIQRLARYFVETGIRERNALIDAVHDVVAPMIPEWTRRDTMDAISGYGKYKQLTKDEISVALRDLKGQMQQAGKIEDMLAGKAPLKTGIERRTPSDEERALIKEVNRLKAEANYTVTDAATQLKSRLQQWKTTLTHRIADYERRLREGDFATKKRPERKADAEVQRLQLELSDTKRRFYQAMERDRLARRTTPRKVFEGTVHTVNTARAIMTSFDLSAVLRQGGFVVMGHPLRGLREFPDMLRAFASRQGQFNAEQAIRNHPLYAQAKASGLYLSEKYEGMSKLEEMYMTPWAEKIPIVAGSERAYTTFLNKLRMDSFAAMVRTLTPTGQASAVEAKAIANFVNVATGRGKIGAHDRAAAGLNTVFFAPRFVASRFQLVLGQPFYHGTAATRKLIAGEYGRYLAGIGVLYGLANFFGADIQTDPRSSDFGKIVVGNTRIDPLSGLQQGTVLMTRLGTGETMNLQGRVTPIRGKVPFGRGSAADVIARFARSKLSPAFGTAVNLLAGTDYAGQPVTPASLAGNLVTPISLSDIYQAMDDLGVPEGMAVGLLSILGMNLQTYNQ